MNDKKFFYLVCGIAVSFLVIGVSFAFWYINLEQSNPNVVTSGCFSLTFTEGNAINLNDAYPISDEEGIIGTPYTFMIQNICTTDSSYQINLETITGNGKVLPDKYLKANLQEGSESKVTTKLDKTINSELETETTIEGAMTSYKLFSGVLAPNEEKSYSLRLWMHSDVGPSSDSMNATYQGKINIVTSYTRPLTTLEDTIKNIPVVTSESGLYEVRHDDANITYTENVSIQNMLKQTELRYVGKSPNNYVKFNEELWRVIGLVNTPEGQRVKLVRNESIGNYSWDSSDSSINGGSGINEWSTSSLQEYLNLEYYANLSDESKLMVEELLWNQGSNDLTIQNKANPIQFYDLERSNQTGIGCNDDSNCNDTVLRKTTWLGRIGLMYPSDYGFATIGGSNTNYSTCMTLSLFSWNQYEDCYTNNWLHRKHNQWLMTAYQSIDGAGAVFYLHGEGSVFVNGAFRPNQIYPTFYLKNQVKVMSGDGSFDFPYELVL